MSYGPSEFLEEHDATNGAKRVVEVGGAFSYKSFTSNSSLAVKTSAGVLHSIMNGAISSPTIAIYDSLLASGPIIAIAGPNLPRDTFPLNISFATGLTVNTAMDGASPNLTFVYR